MSRKWVIALVVATLLLGAVAPVAGAAEKIKLSLWTHNRHMMDLVDELLREFNATIGAEKGIEVSLRVVAEGGTELMLAAQQQGMGPDLFNIPTSYQGFGAEYEAGLKMYFDDLPGFAEWKVQFPEWYWVDNVTTWKGKVFAIPVSCYNARLVYNKDLFREAGLDPERPPETFSEWREYAKRISQLPGKYGMAWPGAETWMTAWMPSQFIEASGLPAWFDWSTGRFEFTNMAPLFQLLLDMKADGSLFPGVTSLNNDALRAQFAAGNIGMFLAVNWDVGVLNDQFPARCDWGVALPPVIDGHERHKVRAMIEVGLYSINGQTKYPEAAWEVVKWFNSYEIRARFYEEGKLLDPDPKVREYAKKEPTAKGFAEFAQTEWDYAASWPKHPGFVQPSENPCSVFSAILARGGDLMAELQRLEDMWNAELDKFYAENPDVRREWNIYPNFDRKTGVMGDPLLPSE